MHGDPGASIIEGQLIRGGSFYIYSKVKNLLRDGRTILFQVTDQGIVAQYGNLGLKFR